MSLDIASLVTGIRGVFPTATIVLDDDKSRVHYQCVEIRVQVGNAFYSTSISRMPIGVLVKDIVARLACIIAEHSMRAGK